MINVKSNHPEKTEHPCQFPIELVERCVLALTNEKSWVLDAFAGVGSTVIAAIKNNRSAIGIEKEEEYCWIDTNIINSGDPQSGRAIRHKYSFVPRCGLFAILPNEFCLN